MIKTVFLDVDNTLLDFDKCARRAIREGFAKRSLPCTDETWAVFRRVNHALWKELEKGVISQEQLFAMRWNCIFAALDLRADGVDFEAEFRVKLREGYDHEDGAEELLAYLAPRYPLYVVSNGPQEQQVRRLEKAGLLAYLRDVFTSERMGVAKPDKAFFRGCFDMLPGTKPEETLIIGDSLTADIAGGAAFGLQTCWYDREGSGAKAAADYTVCSLDEIRQIF